MPPTVSKARPDYGIDAPAVLRNLFLFGVLCLVAAILLPTAVHLGNVELKLRPMFYGTGALLLAEGLLYLLYVKHGKFGHRDFILSQHIWRGDEHVLDVGCGRGLLVIGAAKRLRAEAGGRATGVDIWSTTDMGGNSIEATARNLELEEVADRCTLLSEPAQTMSFPDGSFDVVVSNLCLHNIENKAVRAQALWQIVRVLKPGGAALISDYKLTREYASIFRASGLTVRRRWGSVLTTFPPLRVVIARKPIA